ncbi:MAG TPA: hypothetical protein EYO33_03400 [Phycisphaerales bacterium]|nr:hypothetical protein [Phycisphaerales bacterium]
MKTASGVDLTPGLELLAALTFARLDYGRESSLVANARNLVESELVALEVSVEEVRGQVDVVNLPSVAAKFEEDNQGLIYLLRDACSLLTAVEIPCWDSVSAFFAQHGVELHPASPVSEDAVFADLASQVAIFADSLGKNGYQRPIGCEGICVYGTGRFARHVLKAATDFEPTELTVEIPLEATDEEGI